MPTILLGAVFAAVVIGLSRSISERNARASASARAPAAADHDGIVPGAEPLHLQGSGDRGVLLLHGFNDTPQSVGQLAHALHERGWSVTVPLLPHHGRGSEELARRGDAQEWIDAARVEWELVRARSPHAVLAGQSMGGALAVLLAEERAPAGLVLLAPYLSMGRLPRYLAAIWPVWQLFTPKLVSDVLRGMRDPDARRRSLGNPWFTPRLVGQLSQVVRRARRALPGARAPALVMHARVDYRIPSESAVRAFDRLGATDKTLVWRDDSGHVLAADAGREHVYAIVGEWMEDHIQAR